MSGHTPEPGFVVDAQWCQRARESVAVGMEQLDQQRISLDLKVEFWRGYLGAIDEIEEHIRRAAERQS